MSLLGHKLHGQGPEKVILFNDWMGDCTSWTPVLPYLDAERFTYALVDLRGYGRSIHLRGEYTETEAATDTLALTDHLGWDRIHLVGFSMTGMVAERLAMDVPERLKSVVAIAAVSAAGFKMLEELRQLAIQSITNDNKAMTYPWASLPRQELFKLVNNVPIPVCKERMIRLGRPPS